MILLKKNPAFSILVLICLVAFAVGAYLAIAQFGEVARAKQKATSVESRLNNLRFADPAPTEENVEASGENIVELRAELKKIHENLQRGVRITTTGDSIGVMASIQQFITDYRRKAATRTNGKGEADPIKLPNKFAFGFERYAERATPLDDPKASATLDKQRQILSHLLDKLYASDPQSIVSVQREILEQKASGQANDKAENSQSFQISKAVSARVPGAIDTLAFSLKFTGYTDTLRDFLNNLARFDWPIVVRSIEVTRPPVPKVTTIAPPRENDFAALFGPSAGSEKAEAEELKVGQKPVISENISTFNVVLEFIEIVLPADTAEDKI